MTRSPHRHDRLDPVISRGPLPQQVPGTGHGDGSTSRNDSHSVNVEIGNARWISHSPMNSAC